MTRKDAARVTPALLGASSLGLAALGLGWLGLSAAPAQAQTQDLFVSNTASNTISRFAGTGPGTFSTTPTTLSGGGLSGPSSLAFDAKGDLFAVNAGGITELAFTPGAGAAPGSLGAARTVETGLNTPSFLAFGPVPAVPEASTTVSLGLLLALGMGGVAARKKRKA